MVVVVVVVGCGCDEAVLTCLYFNLLARLHNMWCVTDYLNYRYEVKAQLDAMGTTIDSKRAAWLQDQVRSKVAQFKLQDTNFAKFYDRYFAKDKFDYVYEGE